MRAPCAIVVAIGMFLWGSAFAQVDPFPPEAWHQVYDSTYGNDVGSGVAIDSQGNVVVVGYRANQVPAEKNDAYARKYSPQGGLLCEIAMKGPDCGLTGCQGTYETSDAFSGVAIDSQDNIVIAGTISGMYFPSSYYVAPYFNKYDHACAALWASPVIWTYPVDGVSAWQSANSVALDSSNNIYPTGSVFGGWGGPEHEWATWKYDTNGILQSNFPVYYNYKSSYDAYGVDYSYDIAVDGLGNMIVVGIRGENRATGNYDWHVRKYDPTGVLLWSDTYAGTANLADYAYRVAVDSQNHPVVVGYTNKGTDNSAGADYDWLIIKYAVDGVANAGQRLWTKTYESAPGRSEAAQALAIDGNDNIIVGGYINDGAGSLTGRLALLDKTTGDTLGERIITTTAHVIPLRLAYRNGAIAIGGYIYDPAGLNHNMYTALLQTPEPIVPTSPANGTSFDACSYFAPPVFEWTLNQTFQKVEIYFYTSANPTKPTKIKVKDSKSTQLQMTANDWKKILKLPGLAGGDLNWKIVGTNTKQPVVESDVITMTVAAPEPAGKPDIFPVTKAGIPTLTWANSCGTKFKATFGSDALFTKKKLLTFNDKDPTDNTGTFSAVVSKGNWTAIRKLVKEVPGSSIYWYVESWDVIMRYQKTDTVYFNLEP